MPRQRGRTQSEAKARGQPARGPQGWAPSLTTLILRPVATVEQGLVGVPEELVPGHRVHKAEAGVAVNEGQPAAQLPQ